MFPIEEFRDCLLRVAASLNRCGIRFYITGGAAFIAYGDPRTTQDVDLVIEVEHLPERLSSLIAEFDTEQFLLSEQVIREAVRRERQFQLIDTISTLKIDVYPRELVPGAMDRARMIEIFPGELFPVSSLPDLVISKLMWIRKGSHKSRRDVKQLFRGATEVDRQTARDFADDLSLVPLLDEVLAEPDEIDL